jgi:hypothetical protein
LLAGAAVCVGLGADVGATDAAATEVGGTEAGATVEAGSEAADSAPPAGLPAGDSHPETDDKTTSAVQVTTPRRTTRWITRIPLSEQTSRLQVSPRVDS